MVSKSVNSKIQKKIYTAVAAAIALLQMLPLCNTHGRGSILKLLQQNLSHPDTCRTHKQCPDSRYVLISGVFTHQEPIKHTNHTPYLVVQCLQDGYTGPSKTLLLVMGSSCTYIQTIDSGSNAVPTLHWVSLFHSEGVPL